MGRAGNGLIPRHEMTLHSPWFNLRVDALSGRLWLMMRPRIFTRLCGVALLSMTSVAPSMRTHSSLDVPLPDKTITCWLAMSLRTSRTIEFARISGIFRSSTTASGQPPRSDTWNRAANGIPQVSRRLEKWVGGGGLSIYPRVLTSVELSKTFYSEGCFWCRFPHSLYGATQWELPPTRDKPNRQERPWPRKHDAGKSTRSCSDAGFVAGVGAGLLFASQSAGRVAKFTIRRRICRKKPFR